jgi:hypothetical protein
MQRIRVIGIGGKRLLATKLSVEILLARKWRRPASQSAAGVVAPRLLDTF